MIAALWVCVTVAVIVGNLVGTEGAMVIQVVVEIAAGCEVTNRTHGSNRYIPAPHSERRHALSKHSERTHALSKHSERTHALSKHNERRHKCCK